MTNAHNPDPRDNINKDVLCPRCEYNLRGQAGPRVTCPECGHEESVGALLAIHSREAEGHGPSYREIQQPVIFLNITLVLLALSSGCLYVTPHWLTIWPPVLIAVAGIASWAVALHRTHARLGLRDGLGLALAMHGVAMLYLAALGMLVGSFIALSKDLRSGTGAWMGAAAGFLVAMAVLGYIGYRCDRWVGRRCKRRFHMDCARSSRI